MTAPSRTPTKLRYERKYLVEECSVEQVGIAVLRHPALFLEVFPPRIVNSVYLDTVSLRDYSDHLRGASHRSKTRVRWYGALEGQVASGSLERKQRFGAVGGKQTFSLGSFEVPLGLQGSWLDTVLANVSLEELVRLKLSVLRPALLTRYQRRYYASCGGRIRLTVDWALQARALGAEGPSELRGLPGVVVELKYSPSETSLASAIAAELPYRLGRFSKYVLGISTLVVGAKSAG